MDYDHYAFTVLDLARRRTLFSLRAHDEDNGIGARLMDPHKGQWFCNSLWLRTMKSLFLIFDPRPLENYYIHTKWSAKYR